MERLHLVTILAVLSVSGPAARGSGDDAYWSADRVEAAADRLEARLGDQEMVYETIGNYEGHSIYLVLRGRTGSAELHETESDLYVAKRGRATLVIGGELVDARALPRRQQRGTAIRGGTRQPLDVGDVVHVPEAVAHQLILDADEPFLYLLIKFDEEPLTERR